MNSSSARVVHVLARGPPQEGVAVVKESVGSGSFRFAKNRYVMVEGDANAKVRGGSVSLVRAVGMDARGRELIGWGRAVVPLLRTGIPTFLPLLSLPLFAPVVLVVLPCPVLLPLTLTLRPPTF